MTPQDEFDTAARGLMDDYFDYQVGQLVLLKSQVFALKADLAINGTKRERYTTSPRWNLPTPSVILERKLIQCHGGIQGFYTIRRVDNDGRECFVQFASHEVLSFDDFADFLKQEADKDRSERAAVNPTTGTGDSAASPSSSP